MDPQTIWGLRLLFDNTDDAGLGSVCVNIIAVHGLGANPDYAWIRHRQETERLEPVNWLVDLLPQTLRTNKPSIYVRVFCFSYQSAWIGKDTSKNRLETVTDRLLDGIQGYKLLQDDASHPILFLGHSFGGLVIEQALVKARNTGSSYTRLNELLGGIVLFGTPYQDSSMHKWGQILAIVAELLSAGNSAMMRDVDEYSMKIFDLVFDFMQLVIQLDLAKMKAIMIFCENKATDYARRVGPLATVLGNITSTIVVDEKSAVLKGIPYLMLDSDHIKLNKYAGANDGNYKTVSENIARIAAQTTKLLRARREENKCSGQRKCWVVPRKRVPNFVGRNLQLLQMAEYFSKMRLRDESQPGPLILQALGGQGKSQLALEYCQRARDTYRGIFWVHASSEASATQSFTTIALDPRIPLGEERDSSSIRAKTKAELESWEDMWLLVFDNYDQTQDFVNIQDWFPMSTKGDIIITSRVEDVKRLGEVLEVPPLSKDESVELLLHNYREPRAESLRADAARIVHRFGYLALAIDQAAAYLNHRRASPDAVSNFLTVYEAQKKEILGHTPRLFWEYSTMQVHGTIKKTEALSAFTTWEMSLQQLQSEDGVKAGDLRHLLTLASFLGPTNVAEFLFEWYWECHYGEKGWMVIFVQAKDSEFVSGATSVRSAERNEGFSLETTTSKYWSRAGFWDIKRRCENLSIIQNVRGEEITIGVSFDFHPLIRDWLQQRLDETDRRLFEKEAIDVIVPCARMTQRGKTSPAQRSLLVSHADPCMATILKMVENIKVSKGDDSILSQAECVAYFYNHEGRFGVAQSLYWQVLDRRMACIGKEHPDTLTSMNNLALVLDRRGDYAAAEKMYQQTLLLQERVLGKEHSHTLTSISNLAHLEQIKLAHRGSRLSTSLISFFKRPWKKT